MRKAKVLFVALLVAVLYALPPVSAATLPGFPFYVYLNMNTGAGNIYIWTAGGNLCGTATLTGIGTDLRANIAWETARDIIVTNPPLNSGTWYTNAPEPGGGFCSVPTISSLKSFNIDF